MLSFIHRSTNLITGKDINLLPYYSFCIFAQNGDAIPNTRLNIENLKTRFGNGKSFDLNDIAEFYRENEPELKQTAVNWRIYTLVKMGILNRIGRGRFVLGKSRNFIPDISSKMKTINRKLNKAFPYLQICIWNTSAFNEFMQHQPGRFFIIIEIEREAAENLFFFLKEMKYPVFIQPDSRILEKYLPDEKEVLIIKPLVSEAPLIKVKDIITASLEKMLVDIFCDELLFAAQQGAEMRRIFQESMERYSVNMNRMIRYASRRGKKERFTKYLNSLTNLRQK